MKNVSLSSVLALVVLASPAAADLFGLDHGPVVATTEASPNLAASTTWIGEDAALADSLQAEEAAATNPDPRTTYGAFGAAAYPAAAATMRLRNGAGVALTAAQKRLLTRQFGSKLVDEVRISYDASMLNQIGSGENAIFLGMEPGAQCFGVHLYVRAANAGALAESTLVHEMKHAQQFQSRGYSYVRQGYDYFVGHFDAGFSYENNWMEAEARRAAADNQ